MSMGTDPVDASSRQTKTKAGIPLWVLDILSSFASRYRDLWNSLELAKHGIRTIQGLHEFIDSTRASVGYVPPPPSAATTIEVEGKGVVELAEQEIAGGFKVLHAQFLISLWGEMENLVHALLTTWFENDPDVWSNEQIAKIRIPLAEYHSLDAADRADYLAERLEQDLPYKERQGVSKFETLLAVIGLSGRVPADVGKSVFELQQIRNLLVHRSGIADRHFVSKCPWLGYKVGDTVSLDAEGVGLLHVAIQQYLTLVLDRIATRYNTGTLSAYIEEQRPPLDAGAPSQA